MLAVLACVLAAAGPAPGGGAAPGRASSAAKPATVAAAPGGGAVPGRADSAAKPATVAAAPGGGVAPGGASSAAKPAAVAPAPVAAASTAELAPAGRAPSGAPSAAELAAALDALDASEVMVLEEPASRLARVLLATRVAVGPELVRAMLAAPGSYRGAVPALRRAEIESSRRLARGQGSALLVSWELEVPLWNLAGKLWLEPTPDGAVLDLAEGDLVPGRFRLSATPDREGTTLLLVECWANFRDANWVTRRLARRNPLAEPAMTAANAYVLLRSLRLHAERRGASDPRRAPRAAAAAPAVAPGGERIGELALQRVRPRSLFAAVHSRPDGRLAYVQLAVLSRVRAEPARQLLEQPGTLQALPGWRQVRAGAAEPAECAAQPQWCWRVSSNLPFVDLDATWKLAPGSLRGRAVAGAVAGAVMGWDVVPGSEARAIVLTMHPRLDRSGYIPRKLMEAEPLLEHGLALGLAVVDAVSLARALEGQCGSQ